MRGNVTETCSLIMPTRMRGSAIVLAAVAICISAFVDVCWGCGGATCGFGGGGAAHAASKTTRTPNRAFMPAGLCKNVAQHEISNFKFQMEKGTFSF